MAKIDDKLVMLSDVLDVIDNLERAFDNDDPYYDGDGFRPGYLRALEDLHDRLDSGWVKVWIRCPQNIS